MHDQRSPVGDDEKRADADLLGLLLEPDDQRPWSTDELLREAGDRLTMPTQSPACTLRRLIHRCGEFVFATRPAVQAARLAR